jgi:hypothetical protein
LYKGSLVLFPLGIGTTQPQNLDEKKYSMGDNFPLKPQINNNNTTMKSNNPPKTLLSKNSEDVENGSCLFYGVDSKQISENGENNNNNNNSSTDEENYLQSLQPIDINMEVDKKYLNFTPEQVGF